MHLYKAALFLFAGTITALPQGTAPPGSSTTSDTTMGKSGTGAAGKGSGLAGLGDVLGKGGVPPVAGSGAAGAGVDGKGTSGDASGPPLQPAIPGVVVVGEVHGTTGTGSIPAAGGQ